MDSITPVESVRYVALIVTNNVGEVLCTMGGDNQPLARTLAMAHQVKGFPVTKKDSLMSLGQDCYEVTREYALAVSGTFLSQSWEQVAELQKLPTSAKFTFVVTV